MRSRSMWFVAAALAFSLVAPAAQAAVLRVLDVESSDLPAYLKQLEQGKALMKKAGIPYQIHIWRGRFAGSQVGQVVITIEYADMNALAAAFTKTNTDPDLKAWLKGLDAIRKVTSDSIYEEQMP